MLKIPRQAAKYLTFLNLWFLISIQQRNFEVTLRKPEISSLDVQANVVCFAFDSSENMGKPVLDRGGLIINIFNAHAHTKEAKLQAELAALMYKMSRLVRVCGIDGRQTFGQFGEAEIVSARGRAASGGAGFVGGA
ncbi:unnamed protein product [Cochlearia groenlandica]